MAKLLENHHNTARLMTDKNMYCMASLDQFQSGDYMLEISCLQVKTNTIFSLVPLNNIKFTIWMSTLPPRRTAMPSWSVVMTISLGTPLQAEMWSSTISATPLFANLAWWNNNFCFSISCSCNASRNQIVSIFFSTCALFLFKSHATTLDKSLGLQMCCWFSCSSTAFYAPVLSLNYYCNHVELG